MTRRHGRETVVYVDGYDVTGDSTNWQPNDSYDTVDVKAYGDRSKNYIPGMGGARVGHSGWLNTNANRSQEVLSERVGTKVGFAATFGTVVGAPGIAGSAAHLRRFVDTAPVAGAVAFQADYELDEVYDWIETLWPKSSLSGNGDAKQDAATTNGIRAYLQVFSILGGTPVVKVQHSATGTSSWSDLITFTGATAAEAQAAAASGSVNAYLRATVTGGSATAFIGYRRL